MDHTSSLRSIRDDELTTINRADDLRGRKVLDMAGEDIGHVDDLLVDDREHRVRFLRVAAGGFFGVGQTKFLIPVDAVTKVVHEVVHVDQTRDDVARGPRYDPELMSEPYLKDVFTHFGNSPWWGTGYSYPTYPDEPE